MDRRVQAYWQRRGSGGAKLTTAQPSLNGRRHGRWSERPGSQTSKHAAAEAGCRPAQAEAMAPGSGCVVIADLASPMDETEADRCVNPSDANLRYLTHTSHGVVFFDDRRRTTNRIAIWANRLSA